MHNFHLLGKDAHRKNHKNLVCVALGEMAEKTAILALAAGRN
jgi:hypothetical protein